MRARRAGTVAGRRGGSGASAPDETPRRAAAGPARVAAWGGGRGAGGGRGGGGGAAAPDEPPRRVAAGPAPLAGWGGGRNDRRPRRLTARAARPPARGTRPNPPVQFAGPLADGRPGGRT